MAAIVQRATQRTEAGESLILTDEEKKQLLEEVERESFCRGRLWGLKPRPSGPDGPHRISTYGM